MHHQLVIPITALLAALGLGTAASRARVDPAAIDAVNEVMGFRRDVMGDTLRFDACSVFKATGRPAGFPSGLRPGIRPMLDHDDPRPCEIPASRPRFLYRVFVDSLSLGDTVGFVHLTVVRGESVHLETHTLQRGRGGWGDREARIYAPLQFLPPRDPSAHP